MDLPTPKRHGREEAALHPRRRPTNLVPGPNELLSRNVTTMTVLLGAVEVWCTSDEDQASTVLG
jgi:hypothetical protein